MTLLNPKERSQRGERLQSELRSSGIAEPNTLLQAAWRDYLYAEIWSRPDLDRRSRYFISMSGAACEGGRSDVLDGYVRGALKLGEIALAELREAALHLALYGGWSQGMALDAAVTRVATELGLPPASFRPLRENPWDPQRRTEEGAAKFVSVMTLPAPKPVSPYLGDGILNFVFGEMWLRPELDQRARRWITLVGVAHSSSSTPIRSHIYAAMASGDATPAEMQEFVLQFAVHGGWPKGSVIQSVVFEMSKRIADGLPFEN